MAFGRERRPLILAVIEYYLPGYRGGGTIRSLANLVELLSGFFEFRIITRNHDWRSAEVYDLPVCRWVEVGSAKVMYLPSAQWTTWNLRQVLCAVDFDLLYFSSAFSLAATIKPLILRRLGLLPARPIILGPRGEFSPGAIAIRAVKKRVYLALARHTGLLRDVTWQASTPLERNDIVREIGESAAIIEAIDCPPRYDTATAEPIRLRKEVGSGRICFVSRISRKKNLDYAIDLLSTVEGRVEFDIYGPFDDASYHSQCEAAARELRSNIVVRFRGARSHSELGAVFGSYDLYLFPTRGENFGHTIVEALAAGCPVLISDLTPWRDLQKHGVGWDVSLSRPDQFRAAIQEVIGMDEERHAQMRSQCRSFAAVATDPGPARRQNLEMFLRALQAG